MRRKMRRLCEIHGRKYGMFKALVLLAICCSLIPVHAEAADAVPSYVEIPEAGEYTVGPEEEAVEQDGKLNAGTEFYIRIENQGSPQQAVVTDEYTPQTIVTDEYIPQTDDPSGSLPKTGDYGPDKTLLLKLALMFGAGYLFCDYLDKKHGKYIH